MTNELWAGWDSMLNSYDSSQSCEDLAYLRAKVEVRSQDLFSSEEDVVKVLQIVANEEGRYMPSIRFAMVITY